MNGGSNASFTHFTSAAATPTTVTTTNAQNFVDLFAMADEFGMIAGTFTRFEPSPMTGTSSLSAVQIQFIPEPGAVMVLGALGLSLLGGRNGRRTAA